MPSWDAMQKRELERLLAEQSELAQSRVIKTEEGRTFVNANIRLLETLIYGKPTTPVQTGHNP